MAFKYACLDLPFNHVLRWQQVIFVKQVIFQTFYLCWPSEGDFIDVGVWCYGGTGGGSVTRNHVHYSSRKTSLKWSWWYWLLNRMWQVCGREHVNEPLRHDKTNKVTVRPAKTQISLGIRPVWSESSLSAWRKLESFATHWAEIKSWRKGK